MGSLDWKWIAIGVAIMFGIQFGAGLVLGIILAASGVPPESAFWPILIIAILGYLAGGFIVGRKSAGKTIIEPGISAVIAVLLSLVLSGSFGLVDILIGSVLPLLVALLGGYLGERAQGTI